jgi:hypothetical protein
MMRQPQRRFVQILSKLRLTLSGPERNFAAHVAEEGESDVEKLIIVSQAIPVTGCEGP